MGRFHKSDPRKWALFSSPILVVTDVRCEYMRFTLINSCQVLAIQFTYLDSTIYFESACAFLPRVSGRETRCLDELNMCMNSRRGRGQL